MLNNVLRITLILPLLLFASLDQQQLRQKIGSASKAEKSYLLVDLANLYDYSNIDSVYSIFHKAIKIANESQDTKIQADVLSAFGAKLYDLGEMDSSFKYLERALTIRKIENDPFKLGLLYNKLGNVYWFQGKQIEAKEQYEKALKIHSSLINPKEIGRTYNNLANIYRNWGDYKKAIELYLNASDYYKKADFLEGDAWLNYSITLLYKKVNDYPNALRSINNSLKLYRQMKPTTNDSNGIMICYGQLGDIHRQMGNYEEALKYHLYSLRLRRKTAIPVAIADGLMGVGQIYYETAQYSKTIDYMRQSMVLREEANIRSGIETNLKYIGFSYYQLGQKNKALSYLLQSLKIAEALNKLDTQKDVLKMMAQIYSDNQDFVRALECYKKFEVFKDSLNQAELEKQVSVMDLHHQMKDKELENAHLVLDNKIKVLELQRSKAERNILYLAITFFVFTILFVAYFYKKKSKANALLQLKNEEILNAHHLLQNEINERIEIEKQRENLITELKESLSKIKTLRGLIPICASCKKIRNDQGYYQQVEEYVAHHTDAQFSHSICPDCISKLYKNEQHQQSEKK